MHCCYILNGVELEIVLGEKQFPVLAPLELCAAEVDELCESRTFGGCFGEN